MKGAVLSMILFSLFILPFLLYFGIQSLQENAFLKTTTEVQEMVESYGGVTDEVQTVVDSLRKKVTRFLSLIVKQVRALWELKRLEQL